MIFMIVAVPLILACFLLFPRPTATAFALVLTIGMAIGAYLYFQQSDRNSMASLVAGTSTGSQSCSDPESAVFVTLSNASDRPVNVVRFRLIAKRPGYSNEAYSDYFSSDKIIAPHSDFGSCWTLNRYRGLDTMPGKPSPREFEWSVEISSVDFGSDR